MRFGLTQLCISAIVISMVQLSLGKEINSTKDLTKEETAGHGSPWEYDEDSGSRSKSLSSSSSKSHGEGFGKGTGYGENVRKEKGSYGNSEENSASGYAGSEGTSGPKQKGKVHVFNINGQSGPIYAQTYGTEYSKQEQYESNQGGYNQDGPGYSGKDEGGYSSEQYDKSGESGEQGYGGPSHSSGGSAGYTLSSPGHSSGGSTGYKLSGPSHSSGGSTGYSSNNGPYQKPIEPTVIRYQTFNSPASSHPSFDSHARKAQFNQEIHGKIDQDLSVFIRQLGNLPLARFPQGGNQKKNGEREGYLLLPVLPNGKQYGSDGGKKSGHDNTEGSEEQRTHTYSPGNQGKSNEGPYSRGYGLGPQVVPTYGKQQSYPEPQQPSYAHGGNSGQSPTQYRDSKKYFVTFDNNNAQGGSNYGGGPEKPIIYPGIPNEGKINPYENKVYREGAGYKIPLHPTEGYGKDPAPVNNNYYDAGKVFNLKPNGQQFFSGPTHGPLPDMGKNYGPGYPPVSHESVSPAKPIDNNALGLQYANQLNIHKLNQPGAYQNQITVTNLKVKNPNAHLYRQENLPQAYTGQSFPDIGFPIGGDYEQPLENPQQIKTTINHEPMGVSVMYKNRGHGLGGLGGLHLMPSLLGGGHANFQLGGNIGYPRGNPLFHNNLAAQFNQMGKQQALYNRPSQKTKSIALFLSKPNQLNAPGVLPPVMGGNLINPYKSPIMNFRPEMAGKYGNGLLAFNLYPRMHGLASSLSPVIHTDLINLY